MKEPKNGLNGNRESELRMRPGMRGPGGPGRGNGPGALRIPAEKPKDFGGTIKRLFLYIKRRRLQIILVFLLAAAGTLFGVISPRVMGKATTKLFEFSIQKISGAPGASVDFVFIGKITFILGGLYLAGSICSYLQQFIMSGVSQRIVFEMRNDINRKLSKLPLKYFDTRTHGEILSRVTNDIDTIASTLQQSLTQLISAVVTLVGIVSMMLVISPVLTIMAAITLPLSFLVTAKIAKNSQRYFIRQQNKLGELNGHVEEMYTGHQIVKIFGREQKEIHKFEILSEELYQSAWKANFISGIIMPLMNLINNLGYVFICVFGGIFVARRIIEIGDIQAFIIYSKQFTQPVVQTANIINIIQSTVASAERVFEILDESEETPDNQDFPIVEKMQGNVIFQDIGFGYAAGNRVIDILNIEVKAGQTIAIVGPTGAGKTTIVNLLMRFYEPDNGRIMIDGIDIKDMPRGRLRSLLGMVLQDTWLFQGTIKANIAYSREDAPLEEVVQAARTAYADHFIRTLPEGYETVLDEDASNISQGQKQLLSIARAILADPLILILDEATSNIDTRTEVHIQKAMTEMMKGRTSFVIAHRLSTIREADLILVINKGRIIEKGKHEELLAQKGLYSRLYQSQFTEDNCADDN